MPPQHDLASPAPGPSSPGGASRWVLVTGGALRLGREICLAFARSGWNVVCHYRQSEQPAAQLRAELEGLGVQAAVVGGALDAAADAEQVFEAVRARIGGAPDCVVNNASLFEADAAADFSESGLLRQLQTNLVVPLAFGKLLHQHAGGTTGAPGAASLVHLLDQKVFNLNPDYFSYTLSKLALERAVVQQAQALAPAVRVNAVAPGLLYPSGPQTLENFGVASRANLMGQAIDPVRVAEAVVFLAGNPCLTGQSLCVDNGQHLVPVPRDIMFVAEAFLAKGTP